MNELTTFQKEPPKRDAVKAFMLKILRDMVVERVKAGQPVTGLREAFDLVDQLFLRLDQEYGK